MQVKQSRSTKSIFILLVSVVLPFFLKAQTTYLQQDAGEHTILDRLEIKAQRDSVLNFSKTKPYSRKQFIPAIEAYANGDSNSAKINTRLTRTDRDLLNWALLKNSEWTGRMFSSKKPVWKHFYKSPANLLEVKAKDFLLIVNPVIQYYGGKESDNDQHIFLNTRGASFRGNIANKIGFAAYITDNQERDPLYVQSFVTRRKAVPGAGFYKEFKKTGYDYFDARGYVSFNATRYIDIQFGYDKNFIGNGYRSLLLSDFSSPYLFAKLNTRIWKFNYQNLFIELNSAQRLNADQLFPKKYAAIHHLDLGVTRWLNIGLFEAVVFGRENHFEFTYLNPVIFYRSIEQQNGSFDNSVAGLDFKANVARKFQFYGQFLLDEFNLTELRKGSGWWANKYGFQLGAKYVDAFSVDNLDLQLESNRIRPFTYSHRDSVANYTHYNQPLAHPLGANLQEWIATARYQPNYRWTILAKAFYYAQGKDTLNGTTTRGSNIFYPNIPPYRTSEFGYETAGAIKGKTAIASLLLSYEWKPNLFFEVNAVYRKEARTSISPSANSTIIFAGIRWNMHRRNFEF